MHTVCGVLDHIQIQIGRGRSFTLSYKCEVSLLGIGTICLFLLPLVTCRLVSAYVEHKGEQLMLNVKVSDME